MTAIIIISLLIILLIGAVVYFSIIFNGLKQLKNNIAKAQANLDVLLKQRFDEIPQLVEVCKKYMSYETKILKELTELKKKFEETRQSKENKRYPTADLLAQEGNLDNLLTEKVTGLAQIAAENFPLLQTSPQFMNLQERISGLEMEIADRREFYNHSANVFNTRIESLPDVFVAKLLGYKQESLFQADEKEKGITSLEGLG